jgi:hypothetical protein
MRWCTSKDTRMDETGKSHSGNVARGAVYTFEVPDGLGSEIWSVYIRMIQLEFL